jgi:pimeloyl-ACP methyl ester carboxylesterase
MAELSCKYTEQAILFGVDRSLVGILARPAQAEPSGAPAIVILNTGIVHRVGHHRMYVSMSRQLAGAGYTVLRFDFSGIGDSYQRVDRLTPLDASMADIKDAIDLLAKDHQQSRFILIGLCSGADHSVLYGHTDSRVVGMVLLDPSLPPTARFYFHYVAQRLCSLRNWVSVVTGRSGLVRLLLRQLRSDASQHRPEALTLEELPFSPYLSQCYKQSIANGIKILAAFATISSRRTYGRQMVDAFPAVSFKDLLQLEFFPDADHLFSAPADLTRLNQLILNWLAPEQA